MNNQPRLFKNRYANELALELRKIGSTMRRVGKEWWLRDPWDLLGRVICRNLDEVRTQLVHWKARKQEQSRRSA